MTVSWCRPGELQCSAVRVHYAPYLLLVAPWVAVRVLEQAGSNIALDASNCTIE